MLDLRFVSSYLGCCNELPHLSKSHTVGFFEIKGLVPEAAQKGQLGFQSSAYRMGCIRRLSGERVKGTVVAEARSWWHGTRATV